jgi:hypothetical protein
MPDDLPEDALPEDLDITAVRGRYTFPDIRRRRTAGVLYLVVAGVCLAAWLARGTQPVLVNGGLLAVAVLLAGIGAYHFAAGWPLAVQEVDALVAAAGKVGFPVGHASAQLGWRGLRSRPTWRILLYSSEEPPTQRALVLVDAVQGDVLSHFVEANPEDWSAYDR